MEEANVVVTQNLLNYLPELNVTGKAILSNVSILRIVLWSFLIKGHHISSLLIIDYCLLCCTYLRDYLYLVTLTVWKTVQHFSVLENLTSCGLRLLHIKKVYTAPVSSFTNP